MEIDLAYRHPGTRGHFDGIPALCLRPSGADLDPDRHARRPRLRARSVRRPTARSSAPSPRGCRSPISWSLDSRLRRAGSAEHAQHVSGPALLHDHRGQPCIVRAGFDEPRPPRARGSLRLRRRCSPRAAPRVCPFDVPGVARRLSEHDLGAIREVRRSRGSPAPKPVATIRIGGIGPNEEEVAARIAAPVGVVSSTFMSLPQVGTPSRRPTQPVTGSAGCRERS